MNEAALHARFLRGLATSPRACAVRLGAESYSYERVHELALRWAGALLAAAPGLRAVGVLAGKSIESYAGLLAALYAGATAVPLHPDFPAERTRRMVQAAGVSALLVDDAGLAVTAELAAAGLDPPVLAPALDGGAGAGTAAALDAPRDARPQDVAYVLFTSGSTGRPKAVPITHGNAEHYFGLADRRYDFTAADVFSQTFDLNFDCAMFDLFCAWGAGASVVPVPGPAYRLLPEFLAEHGVTVWFSTPSAISLVRRLGGLAPGALLTLRWSLFAGEALQAADATSWQLAASASRLENIYGPTELTITVTAHRWSPLTSPPLCVNGLAPIGRVHEGHHHLLLTESGEPSEVEGELCIAGPQLTPGYLDPGDGIGRFLERDGRTWYRTGDRVRRLGNGELVYLGRRDAQVQVQGVRVELAEIEHALRGCRGVADAVAVARTGPAGTELVVFYTGEPARPAELAGWLRRLLPPAMLPRQYLHVAEFPLNSNRKVDRGRLARLAVETPVEQSTIGVTTSV